MYIVHVHATFTRKHVHAINSPSFLFFPMGVLCTCIMRVRIHTLAILHDRGPCLDHERIDHDHVFHVKQKAI